MSTGVYTKTKKHRENLSKALKEYWSDETRHDEWCEKIQEGIEEYWSEKPQEEFVLGKRYRQKFRGKRDKIGYRLFQREYQRLWREQHPHWYAWRRQKAEGKTKLPYRVWLSWYQRNKK